MSITKEQKIVKNQFGYPYTKEQREWARNYYQTHSTKELHIAFNERYGTNKSLTAIKHLTYHSCKKANVPYTKEMLDFIRKKASIPNITWKMIVADFNKKFRCNKKFQAIRMFANNKGIFTINSRNENYTQVQKQRYEIGEEIIHQKHNGEKYVFVKVCNKDHNHKNNWKLKHRLVWEKANGKIPKGKVIIFLDGNTLNCELSNLRMVDLKTAYNLEAHNYYGKGELTNAFIDVITCRRKIEEMRKN